MAINGLSLPGFTRRKLFNALATVGLLATSPSLLAQNLKLPATITVTAYDTGSSGFNMGVAIGKMLKDKQGSDVRVLPAGNDVARLAPLKANRAQASFMGVGVYFAQEGVLEFASREWGPQPLRLMLSSISCNAVSLAVAKDAGV
ncbi:MAG: C4-dicarboxylate ABC transporter, partial [Betaproteobacteria bacterium]